MNQSSRTATRAQPGFSPPSSGPVYCPPTRPRQARGGAREPPESDIEMLPAQVSDAPNLNHGNNSQRQDTQAQTDDVHMECCPTALDSQPHATPETTQEATQTPQAMKGNDNGSDSTVAHQAPTGVMADPNNLPSNSDVANAGYPRLVTECSMDNLVEAAQVGDTVPVSQHQVTSTNNPAATVNVGYPRLASGTHFVEASEQHIPAPKTNNPPSSARATNAKSTKTPPTKANPNSSPEKANSHPKRSPKQSHPTPGPKPTVAIASGTIQALLNKNAAYQPIANEVTTPATDDDVVVVNETNLHPSSIEHILCRSEQSRDLLQGCKEIIAGWPNSFAHADSDFFAKLATCYLIQFPSFMCYAVTALRILTHAPWNDSMFHGHIRELVLCAIGNGWTWVDQTASIHKRRVSPGEVCAALASYMNQKAFAPGQISDLDTAVIAVCDDLFPDHCELFFSQFSVRCLSCGAEGQISVPLFDTALIVIM